jgi:predicted transposase YbfD/YdcC
MEEFRACFSDVPDPRAPNARHDLLEVLFIALAALLCGAEACTDMAEFGEAKEPFLRQFLRLEHGIPSHDTFSRVFQVLDPQAFEAGFRQFMNGFSEKLSGVVAIDGKAVRGAFDRGRRSTPLHLVNVWAAEARLAVAQRLAPNRNEVAGALEVLQLLSLKGCIVTADALHCHAKMAQGILDRGGEYVLALKENQSTLFADAKELLEPAAAHEPLASEAAKGHGREEQRTAIVVDTEDLAKKHGFPGLTALARVELRRRLEGGEEKQFVRYFALSQPFSPERVLAISRTHWGIENQLHWVLDVIFDEDRARNRKGNGPQNLAILRKLALNLLRSHPHKSSIRRKIKHAGWNDEFLLSLLLQMR